MKPKLLLLLLLILLSAFCQESTLSVDLTLLPGKWERQQDYGRPDWRTERYNRVEEVDHKNPNCYFMITPDRKMSRLHTASQCGNDDRDRHGEVEFDELGMITWKCPPLEAGYHGMARPEIITKIKIVELTENTLVIHYED